MTPHDWFRAARGAAPGPTLGPSAIAAALVALQRGLTGERSRVASPYMDEAAALNAYCSYYWPVSFSEVACVLEELAGRGFHHVPQTVLDLGAGPGPASGAVLWYAARHGNAIKHIVMVDRSRRALDVARRMVDTMLPDGPEKPDISAIAADLEKSSGLPAEAHQRKFDLIMASHSVNELWHGQPDAIDRRREWLASLFPLLTENGLLLIVEPSAHYTSVPLLALRDALLEPAARAGLSCLAPCPHTGPCPLRAAGDRPCFSEWAWTPPREVRALADRAGLDRTSLKAAWLAFGNASPALSAHPAELLPVSLHGRVVSEPMRNKAGRIRVIVCAASGLVTLSAPQNSPEARALGFFDLSRGCLIEAEGLEVRQNAVSLHVGIAAESRLRVILRPPRY